MVRVYFCLLFISFWTDSYSQSSVIDSLLSVEINLMNLDESVHLLPNQIQIYNDHLKNNNDSLRILYYNKIYLAYYKKRQFNNIIEFTNKEIAITKKDKTIDAIRIAKLQARLGYFYHSVGDVLTSINHYNKAHVLGNDKSNVALMDYYYNHVIQNLSVNYAHIADYNNAILLCEEYLTYFTTRKNHKLINRAFNLLGEYYFLQREHDLAKKYFDKTLNYPIHDKQNYFLASALLGKSKIALAKGHFSAGLIFGEQSIEKSAQCDNSNDLSKLKIDLDITLFELHNALNHPKKSQYYFQKALNGAKNYYENVPHRRISHLYNKMGWSQLKKEAYDVAKSNFELAISNMPLETADVQLLSSYSGLIESTVNNPSNQKKNPQKQLLSYVDALLINYELVRSQYLKDQSRYGLAGYVASSVTAGIDYCHEKYEQTNDEEYFKKALVYSEFSKAAALSDAISKTNVNNRLDEKTLSRISRLNDLKDSQVKKLIQVENSSDTSNIGVLKNAIKELDNELRKISPEHDQTSNEDRITKQIDANNFLTYIDTQYDGMIEYYISTDHLYILSYTKNEIQFEKLVVSDNFHDIFTAFNESFNFNNRHHFNVTGAEKIRDLIWPNHLKNGNILIIPDGHLASLSFDALLHKDPSTSKDDLRLSYASSVRILILQTKIERSETNGETLCVTPVFQNNKDLYLEKSIKEVEAISNVCFTTKLEKEKATKFNYTSNCRNYSAIHLSTHAGIDISSETPYIRFINEVMFLHEIYDMKFNNDLVVLSACETGLGKVENSEGVLSLSRAYNYAGIPSVISSLWPVDENSTSEIFAHFYKNLAQGNSSVASLSMAKEQYLTDDKIPAEYKTPYYWAGFVHWGVDAPVSLKKSNDITDWVKKGAIGLAAPLILLFMGIYWRRKKKSQLK